MAFELKDYIEFAILFASIISFAITIKVTQSHQSEKIKEIEKELNYLDVERSTSEKELLTLKGKYENLNETSKDSISKLDSSVKELEKWVEERLNNLERKIENNHRDILNKFEDLFKRLK